MPDCRRPVNPRTIPVTSFLREGDYKKGNYAGKFQSVVRMDEEVQQDLPQFANTIDYGTEL